MTERNIVNLVGYENLISTSVYEYVKTIFLDFIFNNKDLLKNTNLKELLFEFEGACIYYAKLILHFECFYKYR